VPVILEHLEIQALREIQEIMELEDLQET